MRSQRIKDVYFGLIQPLAWVNHQRLTVQLRQQLPDGTAPLFVNLGSGGKYLDGFVNVEGSPFYRKDMWLDMRNGLPFPDNSVDALYTCHVFEHFYYDELLPLMRECYRVAKPGGGIRIVVPSLAKAVQAYVAQDSAWFPDFPRPMESLGGRLYNYLLCEGQHRLIFDFSMMSEMLRQVGFTHFTEHAARDSTLLPAPLLTTVEPPGTTYIECSLIVEAKK